MGCLSKTRFCIPVKKYFKSLFVHCSASVSNLVLQQPSKHKAVLHILKTLSGLAAFFTKSLTSALKHFQIVDCPLLHEQNGISPRIRPVGYKKTDLNLHF